MNLKEGTKLGRYEIRSMIGAGGMGEVYRANDPKIGRDVAIKVLPADFASDSERLERFEREAQAAGGLNHPNILGIYDIDSHDGTFFVVSELLDGEELRDRLNEGPIPLRKTIDYAHQIVSGLAAAHERGIVHRDLKPENLFITKDDRVKILDFGLAKLSKQSTSIDASEDATRKALTDPGMVMGTVGYMSPEQVRGLPADARSDIFSFGVVLYEMLTGRRAFGGDSTVETMHSVLKDDVPELEDSGVRVPPAVEKLMRRCLEKRPEHRFHSAHDLGFALDAIASPTSSSGTGLTSMARSLPDGRGDGRSRWFGRAAWIAAALFLAAALIFGALYFNRSVPVQATMRFAVAPPEKQTFDESLALSPDGMYLAFVTRGSSGISTLWTRSVSALDARQMPGTEGAAFPFWSPDSRTIGFFAGGKLKKIDVAGGPAQSLADVGNDTRGGTWLRDGSIIYSPTTTSPLMRIASTGGPAAEFSKLDTDLGQSSHRWPFVLPDGKHLLYFGRGGTTDKQGIYSTPTASFEPTLLMSSMVSGTYAESKGIGYLLFVREGTLMAQPFDAAGVKLSGEAMPLVEKILAFPGEVGPTAYASYSASAGNLVYRSGDEQTTILRWYDRSGKALEAVTEIGNFHEPVLTKDDAKVIFAANAPTTFPDVYLTDLARGSSTRLTFDSATDGTPVLSPDGTRVVFYSNREGRNRFFVRSTNGSGTEESIFEDQAAAFPDSWSPDGNHIIFDREGGNSKRIDLWILPLSGDRQPFPYLEGPYEEAHAQFSPDGRWVAYASSESGRSEIYIQSFPAGSGKWQVSNTGGDQPQWRSDGKELFYIAPDRSLYSATITGVTSLDVGRPQILFPTTTPLTGITDDRNNYVPSRDGQRFLLNSLANSANTEPLIMVLNWAGEMKR